MDSPTSYMECVAILDGRMWFDYQSDVLFREVREGRIVREEAAKIDPEQIVHFLIEHCRLEVKDGVLRSSVHGSLPFHGHLLINSVGGVLSRLKHFGEIGVLPLHLGGTYNSYVPCDARSTAAMIALSTDSNSNDINLVSIDLKACCCSSVTNCTYTIHS